MTDMEKLISELDSFLHANDYVGAKAYLLSALKTAKEPRTLLPLKNELMGLCRKLGEKEEALGHAEDALRLVEEAGLSDNVGAATTYLNAATVKKAFGLSAMAIPLFERARAIYEKKLPKNDKRLGGLYNNMGLALVDEGRYGEARKLYSMAIELMDSHSDGAPEVAISYLNLADLIFAERAEDWEEQIECHLDMAAILLDGFPKRDGYYAFVCEKCASTFGHYGREGYAGELLERSRRIYEGT